MSQKKHKQSKEQYINVPIWLIKMTSNKKSAIYLTPFELNLYCLIKGLSENKPCYAKDKYFADIFNVSIKHVSKSLQKLNLKGFIIIEHTNFKRFITTVNNISNGCLSIVWDQDRTNINVTTENNVYVYTWAEWWDINDEESDNYNPNLLQEL